MKPIAELTVEELIYLVTDYLMDEKELNDCEDNPSDTHIYKVAEQLRNKVEELRP